VDPPETRYVKSGDVHVAYQVVGDGPIDLVWVPGSVSHLDLQWDDPAIARFFSRLASFSRLILLDSRGSGLSDPIVGAPTLEENVGDILSVMDAAGCQDAVLYGASNGGPMCVLLAASHPARVSMMVLYSAIVRLLQDDEYPWGITTEALEAYQQLVQQRWGTGVSLEVLGPTTATDNARRRWWGRFERSANAPALAMAVLRRDAELDVRAVLPFVQAPTLVLNRRRDPVTSVEAARWVASQIPTARFVELSGEGHFPMLGNAEAVLDEVQEFVTGVREGPDRDRALATVLFVDIVGSTKRASDLGDRGWRELLERYDTAMQRQLERYQGRLVSTSGDGALATFDGPARAIRCAWAVRDAVGSLGLQIRAGLHTGEIELRSDDVGGIAVHLGARVCDIADPGEVLVSRTVVDLVAGSGLEFEHRGTHALKGVTGGWQLYAVKR
jgi:class 3 adenylate cyclase